VKKILLPVVAALLVLTACGSSDSNKSNKSTKSSGKEQSSTSAAKTSAPQTSTAPTSVPRGPRRIVSLSPTATEMLFAVGAGDQVVAVDDQSNYPAKAPKTKLSAYTPNVEAIAKYKPDLVVIAEDTKGLKAGLEKLHLKVLIEPAAVTTADTYRQVLALGEATGHGDEAKKENASIKRRLAAAVKNLPHRAKPLTYYYELDNTLYSATSKTFIGSLFRLAGLRNIADPADKGGKSGGYPQLTAEYLVTANPDLVFLADTKCCKQNAKTFAARPGFAGLHAVTAKQVVPLDDDIASRWGPRIVDLLKKIVAAVRAVPAS